MKKSIVYILLFVVVSVQSQEIQFMDYNLGEFENATELSPDMSQGSTGLTCEFFIIENGAKAVRYFKFTNIGDVSLKIFEAVPNNENVSVSWPKTAIEPGKSDYIVVTYESKQSGGFTNYITVETNSHQPNIHLKLSGFVNSPKGTKPISRDRNKNNAY